MTDPEELRARAASIFQQLRTEERPEGPASEVPETADQAAEPGATETAGAGGTAAQTGLPEPPGPLSRTEAGEVTGRRPRAPATAPGSSSDHTPATPASGARDAEPPSGGAGLGVAGKNGTVDVVTDARSPEGRIADALVGVSPPELGNDPPAEAVPAARGSPRAPHPGTSHALPRIIAIANQKGGVGKTTTAVNLGASLAELQYRVLVVDLDPQGNATTGLGINARSLESSIYDVILHDVPPEDVIEPTTLRNLFVMPATIDLAGAEIELVPVFSRELRLRRALDSIREDYDFILIDCPPSLGLLTVNGLAAAGEVAVPIQCEYYALEGLSQLLRNVGMVQANLNGPLELSTIILTMYDARTRLAEQVVNEVREHFGSRVCRNVVPRTVRLSEAPSFGQPIIVFDSSSRGSIAYRELAKEVSGGASQRVG